MSLTDEQRRAVMLSAEGQLVVGAGNVGTERAIEHARATIDGVVNGMLRLRGPVDTTEFLFALADRAAGGLKEPTDYALRPPLEVAPIKPRPLPWYARLTFADGIAYGFVLAAAAMGWWSR